MITENNLTTEKTIRNVYALFSGMYYSFDPGPKAIKRTAAVLADVPEWLTIKCGFLTMAKLAHFRSPDEADFCRLVRENMELYMEAQCQSR